MLRIETVQNLEHLSEPPRDRMPTLPCDLAEFARAHTGPNSWSAYCNENPRELVFEDPFADLFDF
jgi:hypothetical protein